MKSTSRLALFLALWAAGCGGAARSEAPAAPASVAPEAQEAGEEAADEGAAQPPSSMQPGALPAPAEAPSSTSGKKAREGGEQQTLADAEADLADAQERLAALSFDDAPSSPAAGAGASADARASKPKPAARPGMPPCVAACKAFASLQRAADSICRLAGDEHEKCGGARKVVEDNRAKVTSCSCIDR